MLYTVKSGSVSDEHYGLTLAKAVGLPGAFLDKAEEVSRSLRQQRDAHRQSFEGRKLVRRRKLILNLHEQLKHAAAAEMMEQSLSQYMVQLQEEFIDRMAAIEEGASVEDVASSGEHESAQEVTWAEVFDDEGVDDESLWGSIAMD